MDFCFSRESLTRRGRGRLPSLGQVMTSVGPDAISKLRGCIMTNPLHHTTANNVTHYRSAILSAIGLTLGALCFGSPANAGSPEVYLEDSTVVGSGGTLAIS